MQHTHTHCLLIYNWSFRLTLIAAELNEHGQSDVAQHCSWEFQLQMTNFQLMGTSFPHYATLGKTVLPLSVRIHFNERLDSLLCTRFWINVKCCSITLPFCHLKITLLILIEKYFADIKANHPTCFITLFLALTGSNKEYRLLNFNCFNWH